MSSKNSFQNYIKEKTNTQYESKSLIYTKERKAVNYILLLSGLENNFLGFHILVSAVINKVDKSSINFEDNLKLLVMEYDCPIEDITGNLNDFIFRNRDKFIKYFSEYLKDKEFNEKNIIDSVYSSFCFHFNPEEY